MSKSEFHIPHSTFNIEFFAPQKTLGGYCGGVPPLPIPNREVKPACADGTAMQCGRVGGCLLYFGSSRSNDFGDLFFMGINEIPFRLCPYLSHPIHTFAVEFKKHTNNQHTNVYILKQWRRFTSIGTSAVQHLFAWKFIAKDASLFRPFSDN